MLDIDEKGPIIFDSVHGPVRLHPASHALICTREFQRLKALKQVGAGYWVFPAASNNRYEHCIGTAHLARTLVVQLARQTSPSVPNLSEQDMVCVELAALCHDLGHGPFSHTFERFLDEVGGEHRHEETSVTMFRYALEKNDRVRKILDSDGLQQQDYTFIEELIAGPKDKKKLKIKHAPWPYVGRDKEKAFLYEIVANHWNGIDVDKWDYLARDCHATGRVNRFSFERVLRNVKALPLPDGQWRLCFDESGLYDVFAMFSQRGFMHHTVYNCWKKNAIESMLIEAWTAMDKVYYPPSESGPAMRLSDSVKYPEIFIGLTDTILDTLLARPADNPNVAKCHKLLENIRSGNLYPFVGSFWLEAGVKAHDKLEDFKRSILRIALSEDNPKSIDDLHKLAKNPALEPKVTEALPWVRVGHFTGTKTASEEIYIYSRGTSEPRPVSPEIVAAFIEPIYTYDHVQVFARNECQIDLNVLRKAFVTFCDLYGYQLSPQGQACE